MTAFYIIFTIVLLIILIITMPVNVYISYEDKLSAKIKFLFLALDLFDEKGHGDEDKNQENGESLDKKRKPAKAKKSKLKNIIKKRGLSGFIDLVKFSSETLTNLTKDLLYSIKISSLKLKIIVSGDDTADTALKYGYVCSTVYCFVNILNNVSNIKNRPYVNIAPDFLGEKSSVSFELIFHTRIIYITNAIFKALFKCITYYFSKILLST